MDGGYLRVRGGSGRSRRCCRKGKSFCKSYAEWPLNRPFRDVSEGLQRAVPEAVSQPLIRGHFRVAETGYFQETTVGSMGMSAQTERPISPPPLEHGWQGGMHGFFIPDDGAQFVTVHRWNVPGRAPIIADTGLRSDMKDCRSLLFLRCFHGHDEVMIAGIKKLVYGCGGRI